ncbi:hypothetical protein FOCC_FOCC017467, partial [Frankliniella occidentalis]
MQLGEPGRGAPQAGLAQQAPLADLLHRVRRQPAGRAGRAGDRRGEAVLAQPHRDGRV